MKTYTHSQTVLQEVTNSQRDIYLDKLQDRHWDFLLPQILSSPKSDMQAELTSPNYMGWDNGHLSSQLRTHKLISSGISHIPTLYWALEKTQWLGSQGIKGKYYSSLLIIYNPVGAADIKQIIIRVYNRKVR